MTWWADQFGDGWIEAEKISTLEVKIQADCFVFGQRLVVYGYVDLSELEGVKRLRWGIGV